jgi:hypothetical protein
MQVVRRLGVRYLWIDSLCIIQDDEDWAREASYMYDVYSNSYLTISATSANDSSYGLFQTPKSIEVSGIARAHIL